MTEITLKTLIERLSKEASLLQATISSPRNKTSPKKIAIRPVTIKGKIAYQFSYHHSQKVIHENIVS